MGTLVIACGALARELLEIVAVNRLDDVTVECLPVGLHNRPKDIPAAVAERIERARGRYDRIFIGYADCGTGGLLDRLLDDLHADGLVVERLPGAHCYEFYATTPVFESIHDADPRNFYLTDYLVRHFDRVVMVGLGLDRHPELRDTYFGNYRTVIHLAQTEDVALTAMGRAAADKLGLEYRYELVGYGDLAPSIISLGEAV
ncbi:MAG: DUF1638 domain-containing protein [Acidimicrobiia bacterium]|nr:DUF1638 domain-containing protein [Acidimicrobiia bacterium]